MVNGMKSKKVTDPNLLKKLNDNAKEDEENILQKIVRYGLKDPAIGLLNMGREFANVPHKLSGGKIPELSPSDFNFEEALGVENPNTADKLIQFGGQYAPSFAIPGMSLGKAGKALESIPKAGKFISKAVSESIPQGLYSSAQSANEPLKSGAETAAVVAPFSGLSELMKSTNPKVKNLAKILAGSGAALIGRETAKGLGTGETFSDVAGLGAAALASRGFGTKNDMMRKLTEGVNADIANPRIQAANRLGLEYLTPAEAGISPWASKRQGSLGRTDEGGKMLYEKGQQRQESEKKSIENTLNMIYSDKLNPEIEAAYHDLKEVNLPTNFPLQFKDNAIIEAAEKRVKSRPAYKESLKKYLPENVKLGEGQKDIEPTSLIYWDHVKRALYDMAKEAERKGSGGEANILNQTRRDLVEQMDSHFPEYEEARALYERKKVRESLEKVFDRKSVNGTNFYRALASDTKFEELMHHLRNVPEASQNLKDMRMLFNELMGPPTIKTAKGTEERGMNQARSSGAFLESLIEHVFTKGGNDKAAIEFITSKDWAKQMQEINKISDKQTKLAALSLMLSKGIGQYAGTSD